MKEDRPVETLKVVITRGDRLVYLDLNLVDVAHRRTLCPEECLIPLCCFFTPNFVFNRLTLCSSVGIPAKVSYESQLASHGGVDTKVTEPETAMRIKALCCKAKFEPD
uniref:DNA-directed RNA polymerase n=1 Tax=Ascaris lumbricoides TaxID=6252 RepID=A0A0M3HXX0_ASCLU